MSGFLCSENMLEGIRSIAGDARLETLNFIKKPYCSCFCAIFCSHWIAVELQLLKSPLMAHHCVWSRFDTVAGGIQMAYLRRTEWCAWLAQWICYTPCKNWCLMHVTRLWGWWEKKPGKLYCFQINKQQWGGTEVRRERVLLELTFSLRNWNKVKTIANLRMQAKCKGLQNECSRNASQFTYIAML